MRQQKGKSKMIHAACKCMRKDACTESAKHMLINCSANCSAKLPRRTTEQKQERGKGGDTHTHTHKHTHTHNIIQIKGREPNDTIPARNCIIMLRRATCRLPRMASPYDWCSPGLSNVNFIMDNGGASSMKSRATPCKK